MLLVWRVTLVDGRLSLLNQLQVFGSISLVFSIVAQVSIKNALDESAIVSHRPYGARPNRTRSVMGRVKYTF